MKTILLRSLITFLTGLQLCLLPLPVAAQEKGALTIDLNELALPSDIKDVGKRGGAVYYSTTSKNRPLMPIHFWGEVKNSGLHYIPVESKLVKGLSMAGGGTSQAKLSDVFVTRVEDGKVKRLEFDLNEGGTRDAYDFTLRPGDTVFIKKDTFRQDRAYYTSLVSVAVSIISGVFLYIQIENSRR